MTHSEKYEIYALHDSGLSALEISEEISWFWEHPLSEEAVWEIVDEIEEGLKS